MPWSTAQTIAVVFRFSHISMAATCTGFQLGVMVVAVA